MNLATLLTGSRLLWAPLFTFFFLRSVQPDIYNPEEINLSIALFFVILIELSDAFDGFAARARNEVTDLGKIFDPICDVISRLTIFVTFTVVGILPIWIFLIFLYREFLQSFLRVMNAIEGTVVAAKLSGKLKAISQAAGTFAVIFLLYGYKHFGSSIPHKILGFHPGLWIMLIPALFTVVSFFDYFIPSLNVLKKATKPKIKTKYKES